MIIILVIKLRRDKVKGFKTNNIIQHKYYMLILYFTYSYLE